MIPDIFPSINTPEGFAMLFSLACLLVSALIGYVLGIRHGYRQGAVGMADHLVIRLSADLDRLTARKARIEAEYEDPWTEGMTPKGDKTHAAWND